MDGDPLPTFCPLCVSRCGARAEVMDGTFRALLPDPSHPTGKAICVKGKAAPEIVYHRSRLLHPLRRTRPKDVADPGWERLTWDEALDTVAERLQAAAAADGPQSVGFSSSSPSTSAISDAVDWVQRLIRAFGSPNYCSYVELCAGVGTSLLSTHSASRCPASTCRTSRMPAASCSGGTTRPWPDSRMRRPPSQRSDAARS